MILNMVSGGTEGRKHYLGRALSLVIGTDLVVCGFFCLLCVLLMGYVFLPYFVTTLGVVMGVYCDRVAFYQGILGVNGDVVLN